MKRLTVEALNSMTKKERKALKSSNKGYFSNIKRDPNSDYVFIPEEGDLTLKVSEALCHMNTQPSMINKLRAERAGLTNKRFEDLNLQITELQNELDFLIQEKQKLQNRYDEIVNPPLTTWQKVKRFLGIK